MCLIVFDSEHLSEDAEAQRNNTLRDHSDIVSRFQFVNAKFRHYLKMA
jgi:hypothetical protein